MVSFPPPYLRLFFLVQITGHLVEFTASVSPKNRYPLTVPFYFLNYIILGEPPYGEGETYWSSHSSLIIVEEVPKNGPIHPKRA